LPTTACLRGFLRVLADCGESLKQHIPGYDKGAGGSFSTTRGSLDIASQRARNLAALSTAFDDTEPSTDIVELVALLIAFGN
jgi:hypothetical protein